MKKSDITKVLTKEVLVKDYLELGNMNAIAKKYEISNVTVKNYLIKYGIEHKLQVRYNCNHELFSSNTEQSFYLAGLLAADGNLRIAKGTPYVRLSLSIKDLELMKMVKKITKTESPIRIQFRDHSIINGKKCNSTSLATLEIASRRMFDDLVRFNVVPNKTKYFTIPVWVSEHPLVNHFMRGLADGDGCFYIRKKAGIKDQVHFSIIGTVSMVETYRAILEKHCYLPFLNRKIYHNKDCGILSYGGNGVVNKISKFLYKDSTIYLQRKYDISCLT